MKVLISDYSLELLGLESTEEEIFFDLNEEKIKNCLGCFRCWVKTPGYCVLRDDACDIYPCVAHSDHIVYVSRLLYGSYDAPIKRLLERSLPTQQAFLRQYKGETHHVQRNVKSKTASFIVYGWQNEEEQRLFQELVRANSKNMLLEEWHIYFVQENEVPEAIKEEVQRWNDYL